MMTVPSGQSSAADLLVLHAVRLGGVTRDEEVARRTRLDLDDVSELLLDAEAFGWVTHVEFAGLGGWAVTERGRDEDLRRLVEELHELGARGTVERAYHGFEAVNGRLVQACTDWQLRPSAADPFAVNEHGDRDWDTGVLRALESLREPLAQVVAELTSALSRFEGYDRRFSTALTRAQAGDLQAVAGVGVESCHAVWMELHEDLLSTLGLARDAVGRA